MKWENKSTQSNFFHDHTSLATIYHKRLAIQSTKIRSKFSQPKPYNKHLSKTIATTFWPDSFIVFIAFNIFSERPLDPWCGS